MKNLWRLLLVAGVLTLGSAFFVACDDEESGGDDPPATSEEEATDEGDEATEEASDATAEDGDATEEDAGDSGNGALDDIPQPEDADVTASGNWTGSVPVVDPTGSVDPEAYGTLEYQAYSTGLTAQEVIDFYQENLEGWDEVSVLSGELVGATGGFGIWSQNDNETILWIATGEADGTTAVTVIVGSKS